MLEMEGAWSGGSPSPHSVLCSVQVLYQQTSDQYVTVSQGGAVVVWDGKDMSPLHTSQLRSRVAPRDLWVTDVVLLANANKVTFSPQLAGALLFPQPSIPTSVLS